MKERPILFSAPMVRAILAGKKTQTRRIVKPQPEWAEGAWYWRHPRYNNGLGVHYFHTDAESAAEKMATVCPYGVAGDRLWVRETYRSWMGSHDAGSPRCIAYKADGGEIAMPWKPSIYMPRMLSRITLEVVAVRVERLQDITESDAEREGFERSFEPDGSEYGAELTTACEAFEALWHKINGADSWTANPWVWVVEFRSLYGGAA